MAQRTLVDLNNFDQSELHVAFEVDDGNTYVKIGGLDSAALSYIRLFTNDDRLGFMQRGVNIAHIGIADAWDETENRLLVDEQPDGLTFGQAYRVWSTREKPGTGDGTGLPGADGRTPILAIAIDGERRVLEIIGYTIGGGIIVTPPTTETPTPFVFRSTQSFNVIEGEEEIRDEVEWEQGYPLIDPFGISDISLKFYADEARTMERSADYPLPEGMERLGNIIFLDNFMDNGDNTGTMEVVVRPNIIDLESFMTTFKIYWQLSVIQPDA